MSNWLIVGLGRRGAASAALLLAGHSAAFAHQINVIAERVGDNVAVEARFSDGEAAASGSVRVYDNRGRLILILSLGPDGTVTFPVQNANTGLRIEIDAGNGHSDYRILTPADLAVEASTN